ncbi:MAG: murein biosynthesis integral membrane protein MurJ [Rhodospirillales bacterium CG15_BIG_FIL_POST_REV_8_21_14_020_66_15]|nr:MAG: murein biosynthesis integral membrane protein MurJ [Rhodospirillales bacterium CG15_BIG_FIL_POST_REV_8_21_14_020_66_15]
MNLLKAIATVGGFTLLSRVFGFVRDMLIANFLGAGMVADAFVVAFRFPNLFRRLFAEGAFAAAFVPLFARELEGDGGGDDRAREAARARARQFADQAFAVLALALVVFVAAMEIVMPWAMVVLAGGFQAVPGKMDLATDLSRIAFPYLLFISLVSLQSGILNSLGRFAAAAAAPVLLNLVLIAALLGFAHRMETPGHALAWGVFWAGVAQFAWLAWFCRAHGFPLRLVRPRWTEKVALLIRRILPVVFGASLYQVNLLIGTILATYVSDGAVSYLYYADRVTQLPLGVVGIAVGTALLPLLARQLKAGEAVSAMNSQNRGLEFALLLTLPAAAACLVIPDEIIRVLFERGAFGPDATAATAAALFAYATGLPAYVLIRVLAPGFYAREDTSTPVRVAVAAMLVNIVLMVVLMKPLGHVGIALAASVSAWLNTLLLGAVLVRRGHFALDARLRSRLPRILLATAGMVGVLEIARRNLDALMTGDTGEQVLGLALLVVLGLAAFAAFALALRAAGLKDARSMLRARDLDR